MTEAGAVRRTAWGRFLDATPRGIGAMFARNRDVFLKTWKVNFIPPVLEPIMYLLAIGVGLGVLVGEVDGVPYVRFFAPAIITITMMQTAFFETTYSSYVRMHFQKTWDAVVAGPLTLEDILLAELLWAATRATISAVLMTAVVAMFGLLAWPSALWIAPLAFAVGLMFAGLGMLVTARVRRIDSFSYAFYLFVTPQFLFSGTFFPLHQLPDLLEHLALLLPLTNAVLLVRAAALGASSGLEPWAAGYLVLGSLAFGLLSVALMKKRLIR